MKTAKLWISCIALSAMCSIAQAATWTVCSLGCDFFTVPDAIAGAAAGDELEIGAEFFSGQVIIDKDLALRGAGRDDTTLYHGADTVVVVNPGVTATIQDLEITGGHGFDGGGIRNEGSLVVRRVDLVLNLAFNNGGGIWSNGDLEVHDSLLTQNGTDLVLAPGGSGGGIHVVDGEARIFNTEIIDNGARGGGGIFNQGRLIVRQSTIADNSVFIFGSGGGGVANQINFTTLLPGVVDIRGSTISGNYSDNTGGGLINVGLMTLTNTTVSGNTAATLYDVLGRGGGGIYNTELGVLTLNNVTVTDNTALIGIGGIWNDRALLGGTGVLNLRNSVIADQAMGSDCGTPVAFPATFASFGYNLDTDNTCMLTGTGDQAGAASPGLLPLGDYGGGTLTHDVPHDSSLVDAGNPSGCGADLNHDGLVDGLIRADQRGQFRVDAPLVAGGPCDIGAVEFNLLRNGMMEDDDDADNIPDDWTSVAFQPRDKLICRPRFINAGLCAMHISGQNNVTKMLSQSVSWSGGAANDQFELALFYRTRNLPVTAVVEAVVRFEDTANPGVINEHITVLMNGTNPYQRLVSTPAVALNAFDTVVVEIRVTSAPAGRIVFDDISLVPN